MAEDGYEEEGEMKGWEARRRKADRFRQQNHCEKADCCEGGINPVYVSSRANDPANLSPSAWKSSIRISYRKTEEGELRR
jgi:hypothetical protein